MYAAMAVNTANATAKRARPVAGSAAGPSSVGATLASTTPSSASPSRTAVMRVRCTGSGDSSAPQALWLIVATENAP